MSQQLILPVNNCKLTASWKTDAYKAKFGFTHYGADMVDTSGIRTLYASGDGTVVGTGLDNVVGNVVAVLYNDALNHVTGKAGDVVIRYFHLADIMVKAGQKVNKDTVLGNYGNTGMLNMALHLHIEADTDTLHPFYSPTVSSSSLLKGTAAGASDKSMTNPVEWLYRKDSAPEKQSYTTTNDAFIRSGDKIIPETTAPEPSELVRLREENGKLRQDITALNAKITALEAKLEKVKQAVA